MKNVISPRLNSWSPLAELRQEMDTLFDDFWSSPGSVSRRGAATNAGWCPTCDVAENKDHYLVTLDVPGVPKDQIKIEMHDNVLTVSGERKSEARENTEGGRYIERHYGSFFRSFSLPIGVDSTKVEADYKDGVLKLYVPKAETAKARQIKIGENRPAA